VLGYREHQSRLVAVSTSSQNFVSLRLATASHSIWACILGMALTKTVVEINLRLPSMLHGKKGFERLVWAAKNVLNNSLNWIFVDLDQPKGKSPSFRLYQPTHIYRFRPSQAAHSCVSPDHPASSARNSNVIECTISFHSHCCPSLIIATSTIGRDSRNAL